MTCLEVQGLITPFILNKLKIEELEQFLRHIHTCDSCKEELEVYYILLTSMKQLDEDKDLSGNFHEDFLLKLQKSEEIVIHKKIRIIRKNIVLFFMMIVIALLTSITIGEYVVEEVLLEGESQRAKSNFDLNIKQSREEFSKIDRYLFSHYTDITTKIFFIYASAEQITKNLQLPRELPNTSSLAIPNIKKK